MSEFDTTGSLFLELDESSARSARSTLEDELAGDPITIETTLDAPSGDVGSGGRAGGLGADLEAQSADLESLSSAGEEILQLDERRNELLAELVEMGESGQLRGGGGGGLGGMLGGLVMGGVGLLGIGGLLGSRIASALGDVSLPELPVPEVPDLTLPRIPDLGLPDSIPDLGLPDTVPNLGLPTIPSLGLPKTIPDLGLPDSIPDLGVPDDIPDLGVPDAIPDLGVPDDVPELGLPEIPDLGIDMPPFPIPIPVTAPGGSGETSDTSTGSTSTSLVDEIVGGAATQGAFTIDMLQGAGEFAADNAGGIAAAGGISGLAKALASRFPAAGSGAGLMLTEQQVHRGENRTKRFGNWFANQTGMQQPYQNLNNQNSTSSQSSTSSRENRARAARQRTAELTVEQTVEFDTSRLERDLQQLNRELLRRIEDLESQLNSIDQNSTGF